MTPAGVVTVMVDSSTLMLPPSRTDCLPQSKGLAGEGGGRQAASELLTDVTHQCMNVGLGLRGGGGLPLAGHTQHSQANPTAGGPRQSLTSSA